MKTPPEKTSTVPRQAEKGTTHGEQVACFWAIHLLLEQRPHPYPSRQKLAEVAQTSVRNVQRQLNSMRYSLSLPIAYDKKVPGYYYTRDNVNFAAPAINSQQFVSLAVLSQIALAYRGTNLWPDMRAIFERIRVELRPDLPFDIDTFGQVISFRANGFDVIEDPDLFRLVVMAALERREITFEYHSHKATKPGLRTIEPYHICCQEHAWYVHGRNVHTGKETNFSLVRLKNLQLTEKRFERRADYDPDLVFGTCLGAFVGETPQKVVVRLSGPIARVVSERRWHGSQLVTPIGPDLTEVRFTVSNTPDLKQWVQRWGPDADVMEPQALREEIQRDAGMVHQRPQFPVGYTPDPQPASVSVGAIPAAVE